MLADLDPWIIGRILCMAGFYAATLLAVGGVLFGFAFPALPPGEAAVLKRNSVMAAWVGIAMVAVLCPLQAAYLGGGSWAAAHDPVMLRIVLESAQGDRLHLAILGLLLLPAALVGKRLRTARYAVSLAGLALVLLAFAQVGHTRGDIRQNALLIVHLTMAALWVAALMPLYRLARHDAHGELPSRLLLRFGRIAALMILLLLIAGGILAAWLLGGQPSALLRSSYGQALTLKLTLVALLLGLGGLNRWWLVPALARGVPTARRRLRRSIAIEGVLMGLILVAAAVLMNTTAPMG